jgi:hypothetical protein
MAASFKQTYTQFVSELKETFPEYSAPLTLALQSPDAQAKFVATWKPHTSDVAAQNGAIFAGKGLELVPGLFMTATLWSELSSGTQGAIWKYISSLLLLSAYDSTESFMDLSGFQHDMETMMKHLKEGGAEGMSDLFEKLSKMAESFGVKGDALPKFKIPERLFKGHIAKIAEELVKEFKPEDFGISPEMLESDDPARVFNFLQEIFTKKPEMLMTAAKKIANRIQGKFQRGEIRREDIIREAEELMAEFSENEAFSSLFGSLGEMMKMSEKSSGSESARLREVQERLRRKKAANDTKRAAAAPTNVVAGSFEEAMRAAAAAAESLLNEPADVKKPAGGNKKRK